MSQSSKFSPISFDEINGHRDGIQQFPVVLLKLWILIEAERAASMRWNQNEFEYNSRDSNQVAHNLLFLACFLSLSPEAQRLRMNSIARAKEKRLKEFSVHHIKSQ